MSEQIIHLVNVNGATFVARTNKEDAETLQTILRETTEVGVFKNNVKVTVEQMLLDCDEWTQAIEVYRKERKGGS